MVVRYLKFNIKNSTGGCYDWTATLGKDHVSGALNEVKQKVMAYACKLSQRPTRKRKAA
ncbi:hypothetical protein RVO90_17305 [Enterobacter chengduensis]|uniref:hypothetical protein n=1 Tax=Enterobacter chengduensis TaxID=2494701 RepID=UPI0027E91B37|nr:hypothetical protein [Enterobacter chengduensis]EKS6506996.1 hypothetical protein [Enterobacter hormaechei]HDT6028957.1 hypothetical protein [Enterobacter cloacae subsp. cloacae]ELT6450089.1 hypothetical protein [Enterobacter hormaechei]EMF0737572.1 hypothetical protein [Enterobacter hormaechei]MDV0367707.1 hypothetical protein [Enterobacter chengduensis]